MESKKNDKDFYNAENYNLIHKESMEDFDKNKINFNPFDDNMDDFNEDLEEDNNITNNKTKNINEEGFVMIENEINNEEFLLPKQIVDIMDDNNKKLFKDNKEKIIISILFNGTHCL